MTPVKLMAEYECHPIWIGPSEGVENVPADSLAISRDLATSIEKWAEKYEETYRAEDPISSGFGDEEAERSFAELGLRLAGRLQMELGASYRVTYFNVVSSPEESAVQ